MDEQVKCWRGESCWQCSSEHVKTPDEKAAAALKRIRESESFRLILEKLGSE